MTQFAFQVETEDGSIFDVYAEKEEHGAAKAPAKLTAEDGRRLSKARAEEGVYYLQGLKPVRAIRIV